jgi:hypothetical protein
LNPDIFRRHAPALSAAGLMLSFLVIGIATVTDHGWTRDGKYSILRARTNLELFTDLIHRRPSDHRLPPQMHHPALPATVAYVHAGTIARQFDLDYMAAFNLVILVGSTLGIWMVFLLGRRLYGEAVGVISAALLAFYPRFLSFAHVAHKDAPALVAMAFCTWTIIVAIDRQSRRDIAAAGVATGLAVSTHLIGFVQVPVFLLGYVCSLLPKYRQRPWNAGNVVRHIAIYLVAAVATAWILNPILWRAPGILMKAVGYWTGAFWDWRESYLGTSYLGAHMPWHYIWVHFFAATPLLHAGGFIIGLVFMFRGAGTGVPRTVVLLSSFLLPMLVNSIPGTERYDGMRHALSAVPPFVVVAAFGLVSAWRRFGERPQRVALAGLAALGLASATIESVRLHPYEGAFMNEAVRLVCRGNLYRRLQVLDYYLPFREARDWLNANAAFGAQVWLHGFKDQATYLPLRPDLTVVEKGEDAEFDAGPSYSVYSFAPRQPQGKVQHQLDIYKARVLTIVRDDPA